MAEYHFVRYDNPRFGAPDLILYLADYSYISFACHRAILSNRFRYFRAMFRAEMKEKKSKEITLHRVNIIGMTSVLNLCYYKEWRCNVEKNPLEILPTVNYLQVLVIEEYCLHIILRNMCVTYALAILRNTDLQVHGLEDRAERYICWVLPEAFKKSSKVVTMEDLQQLLKTNHCKVSSEEHLLEVLYPWLSQHRDCVDDILPFIRWNRLDLDGSPTVHKILTDLNIDRGQLVIDSSLSERLFPTGVFVVGGTFLKDEEAAQASCNKDMLCVAEDLKPKCALPFMEDGLVGYQICVLGHTLYVTGGEYSYGRSRWLSHVHCLNLISGMWSEPWETPYNMRHHGMAAVHLDGRGDTIAVVGGVGRHRIVLDTVRVLTTDTGEWIEGPSLPCSMYSPTCAIFSHCLIVVKDDILFLPLCPLNHESFPLEQSTWTSIKVDLPYQLGLNSLLPVSPNEIYITCRFSEDLYLWSLADVGAEASGAELGQQTNGEFMNKELAGSRAPSQEEAAVAMQAEETNKQTDKQTDSKAKASVCSECQSFTARLSHPSTLTTVGKFPNFSGSACLHRELDPDSGKIRMKVFNMSNYPQDHGQVSSYTLGARAGGQGGTFKKELSTTLEFKSDLCILDIPLLSF